MSAFDWNWLFLLIQAAWVTLYVAGFSFILAVLIAILVVYGRLSSRPVLRRAAQAYVWILRGVPDLLIIYFFFFGGILFLSDISAFLDSAAIVPSPIITGIIAVGITSSALLSEVFRGAVLAIDKIYIESATAFGMTGRKLLTRIMIPLALPTALPGIGNIWLTTLKASSLVSVVGVMEILRQAQIAAGSTRLPFIFYSIAALLYMAVALASSWWVGGWERRIAAKKGATQ
ncbi:ABC transporter permease subunit [Pectobacterium polonicum]|uniref:ABC transporter permease subunit n=1 Tax=Pectobacterium polonicum TaxID=2485124 RepID=A0ABV1PDP9_9GAMM|nr:ABC transporter permease subunit [Pectobacterium polonicum]MDC9821677.1 ABC transporter permease subunit [Pectobacterium polonicum]